MFVRILIANRGEIACRIAEAAQEMGIETVAIFSSVDADSPHVHITDFAYTLGDDPRPSESYLNMEKIISIAKESGSQAIHPGYGFLSENAEFAQAVIDAGLVFIGPTPKVIHDVGDKIQAKKTMDKAKIPNIPSFQGKIKSDKDLLLEAKKISFPILIKAAAGGGGKGMRIVNNEKDFIDELDAAKREAKNAFGDDRVYLEKLMTDVRHIEFQILGDHFGHIIHLHERECSIQRRHQKIVEETPSPVLSPELRKKMGKTAIAAAKAVNYTNAGSVEFILDKDNNYYFLEINARLQVEHAITEATTGIDLVKWQIRIANEQPLELKQEDIISRGHSLECRIYAENPERGFLPSPGTVHQVQVAVGVNIRSDLGISTAGGQVSTLYDPMISKITVHAENREESIQKMKWALRQSSFQGVTTNINFLKEVMDHPEFIKGNSTTGFIEEYFSDWKDIRKGVPATVILAAGLFEILEPSMGTPTQFNGSSTADNVHSPWNKFGDWGRDNLDVITDKIAHSFDRGKQIIKKIFPGEPITPDEEE